MLTMLLALMVAAFVMDRLAAGIERDRSDATAAALFQQIRMIADMATVTTSDPLAGGFLPHVTIRREIDYQYRTVANGDNELVFSWRSVPPGTAAALGNRIGEWLGRDRVASPLVLPVDDVPPVRAERVRRSEPDMHTGLDVTDVLGAGPVFAASGRWTGADTDSVAELESVVADEASVRGTAIGRITSVTGQVGTSSEPVTMAIAGPSGSLRAERLDASVTLAADNLAGRRATVRTDLGVRNLVPAADELVDPAQASIDDVIAGSVRVHGTVRAEELTIRQGCVGCAP